MTEENKTENKEVKEEAKCKCGNPMSECKCAEGGCDKGDDCCGGGGCGDDAHPEQPKMTTEQLTHSLNVLMNGLISLMVDKKLITEKELHDKLVKDFGAQLQPK